MANELIIKNGLTVEQGTTRITGSALITGSLGLTGSFNVSGSTTQTGNNTLIGNTVLSGSINISGSSTIQGTTTMTGSLLITGSTTQIGNNTLQGNTLLSGSIGVTGNSTLTGSFLMSGSTIQVGNNTLLGNTTLSGSITISGSFPVGSLSSSVNIYGDTAMTGFLRFNPYSTNIDTSISASYIFVSGSTNDLYFSQNGSGYSNITRLRWLEGNMYTGLLSGGNITATPGGTTFNLSSGSGIIVSLNAGLSTEPFPTIKYVNWNNFTNQTITNLTSSIQTFLGIGSDGAIIQQTSPWYDGQYNTSISIGTVLHQNQSTVNASITYPNVAYGWKQRSYDFIKAFGPLKISGYTLSTSSSLGLTVGSGNAFADGRNYQVDPNNPSYITDPGTLVSKIFRYYQSGSGFVQDTNAGAGYTGIDTTQYNPNGLGVLTAVSPSKFYAHRIFWYPNSATKGIVDYYGLGEYATLDQAQTEYNNEPFIEVPNTQQNAIFLGTIIIKGSSNFTSLSDYRVVQGGLFRSLNTAGSGGGGTGTSITLQTNGTNNGSQTTLNLKQGSNVTLSDDGVGGVTISSTGGGGSGGNAATSSYGSFYSSATQLNIGTANSMSFNNTDISNGVAISGSENTKIKIYTPGEYDIQFSAQLNRSTGGTTSQANIWLSKNGTNVPYSNTSLEIPGGTSKYTVAAWNWFVAATADDYYEIRWTSPDADVQLVAVPSPPYGPAVPSVIATVNRVDIAGSNTGSFQGSFSGSFSGSITNAVSASYALTASYALNGGNGGTTFPYTGSAIITGSLVVTGSTTSTQGFVKPGAGSQYLLADGTTTAGTGGSAFPYTGSARITGSLVLVGSAQITGSFSQGEAGNESSGLYSHAEGSSTHARAPWSHAEGENNYALATGSHAEGSGTETSGYASHAEGSGTYASGNWGHSEGSNAGAEGDYSHAEGESTRAIGKFSHAEGSRVQSIGEASHAEGRYTTASGDYSHAEGYLTLASGSWSHAEGSETTASGLYSHAEGHQTLAFGQKSHAEGNQTRALALNSHAEGANTLANENNAHAEGMYTSASGVAAHSEGEGTKALGYASHAEGQNTIASGDYSHAEGYKNRAEGGSSHAEGSNTQALLYASHAEGSYTVASEEYAHAEGYGTIASGYASHAEGHYTTASGNYSHAEGSYTIAKGDYQHVQGQYNISSSAQSAFIVGNGTSDSNRSNLIFASGSQVQITGSAKITGSLDVTGSLSNGLSSTATGNYSHAEGRTTSAGTTKGYLADSILAGVITLSSSYSNATSSFSVGDYLVLDDRPYSYYFGILTSKITSVTYTAPNTVITLVDNSINTEDPPAIVYNITKPDSNSVGNITYGGNYSHAEGLNTRAIGDYSHAEGISTFAIGDYTHAEGSSTISVGASSHAEGLGTIASGQYQHVQGLYNIASLESAAFIHGNGTLDNNRSNLIYAAGNQVQITGSLNVSGSITGSLFGTSSYATNALTASYIIGGGGGSAFPYTGTAVITGSLIVTSTIQLDGSLTDYATVNSTIVGSNNLYTQATGSYTATFVKYTVSKGTNSRAGEFIVNWNDALPVEYTDVSTRDIGNTTDVVFSSTLVTGNIQINTTTATSGWKIKTLATFI